MPFRTRLSFTRGTPRGLFGSNGLIVNADRKMTPIGVFVTPLSH